MWIGVYWIESELGCGGLGLVWKVQWVDGCFEGFVVIKLLYIVLVGYYGVECFYWEGVILLWFVYVNIVYLLDVGVIGEGQFYFVLELVDGKFIDVYCDECCFEVCEWFGLLLDVMSGVWYVYVWLIVYCDFKLSNIFVMLEGQVKFLDFGIVKLLQDELGDVMLMGDG